MPRVTDLELVTAYGKFCQGVTRPLYGIPFHIFLIKMGCTRTQRKRFKQTGRLKTNKGAAARIKLISETDQQHLYAILKAYDAKHGL